MENHCIIDQKGDEKDNLSSYKEPQLDLSSQWN